jgi:hypothetical protein
MRTAFGRLAMRIVTGIGLTAPDLCCGVAALAGFALLAAALLNNSPVQLLFAFTFGLAAVEATQLDRRVDPLVASSGPERRDHWVWRGYDSTQQNVEPYGVDQ